MIRYLKVKKMNKNVKNAVLIGSLCSVAYLAVYFARNILGTVSPEMIESGVYTTEYIGSVSSLFFIFYAAGQFINGFIGDRIKTRYMISFGLGFAGICNWLFTVIADLQIAALVYGLSGFFLSMIYGPMTKVVSENVLPKYAPRCSLGYTFASLFGSPLAGIVAAVCNWQLVFISGSATLLIMAVICFILFLVMENKDIVKYNQYKKTDNGNRGIKLLIKRNIIRFTIVSFVTGIIRTTVVFWMPTYTTQYLGFPADTSAVIFTISTLVVSVAPFITVFIYEKLKNNMYTTMLITFVAAATAFLGVYIFTNPVVNISFLVIGILAANSAATVLWSLYCPSLADTGMVSSATGYLDCVSYAAASLSSIIFGNAVSVIGWGNLILIWTGLMVIGVIISIRRKIT